MTHWRKNLDGNYISGEDLKGEIKGLRPSMDVEVVTLKDGETFDRNTQEKQIRSALYLKEIGGKDLPKPCLLNVTNAKFFESLTGTPDMDGWGGATATMYAQPDKRHGHVVRFKKYIKPNTASPDAAITAIGKAKTGVELKAIWDGLTKDERSLPQVAKAKNDAKGKLA